MPFPFLSFFLPVLFFSSFISLPSFPFPFVCFSCIPSSFLANLSISATFLVAPLPRYLVLLSPALKAVSTCDENKENMISTIYRCYSFLLNLPIRGYLYVAFQRLLCLEISHLMNCNHERLIQPKVSVMILTHISCIQCIFDFRISAKLTSSCEECFRHI